MVRSLTKPGTQRRDSGFTARPIGLMWVLARTRGWVSERERERETTNETARCLSRAFFFGRDDDVAGGWKGDYERTTTTPPRNLLVYVGREGTMQR